MPNEQKEPESYGSERDRVSGYTGQHVGDTTAARTPEHADFHDSRREKETSGNDQGGLSQPEWTDHVDVLRPAAGEARVDDPTRKVTATFAGARREGFFRKRDYE
jgi:hypothetical protein